MNIALLVAYVSVLKYMSETAEKKSDGIIPVNLVGEPPPYQREGEFA